MRSPNSLTKRALCTECEQVFLREHMFAFGFGGLCIDCALVGAPMLDGADGAQVSAENTTSLNAQIPAMMPTTAQEDTCNATAAASGSGGASSSDGR